MSFWTPDEVKIIEENRSLIESGDVGKIIAPNSPVPEWMKNKLIYSFYKLGLDVYKGLDYIPESFYRWTFIFPTNIRSVVLPENVKVSPYAFRGTLIDTIAVPSSTKITALPKDIEEIYYEAADGPACQSKVSMRKVRFDHSSPWEVKLEPNYVYAVYQSSRDKVRIRGTDGINPVAWVAFPENLREIGKVYKVEELSWNGKNYRAKGKITEVN